MLRLGRVVSRDGVQETSQFITTACVCVGVRGGRSPARASDPGVWVPARALPRSGAERWRPPSWPPAELPFQCLDAWDSAVESL